MTKEMEALADKICREELKQEPSDENLAFRKTLVHGMVRWQEKIKALNKADVVRPLHTEEEMERILKEMTDTPEFKAKMKKAFDDLILYGECRIEYSNGNGVLADVSGSLLQSLHQDLKGFQEMGFLTPDAKMGLGIAIEQVERYMRGELEARQQ